jgi:hypothetical protein
MHRQQIIWGLWLAGTALIVGSWANVVTPTVGWVGFAIAGVAALISWMPAQVDRSRYPLTQEGLPVEPSGAPVPPDLALEPGTPVLAYSQGRWWRATVIQVEENGQVVLHYPGWEKRVERVPRRLLQIDPDPSRRPLTLPSGPLERWQVESPSEDVKATQAEVRRPKAES